MSLHLDVPCKAEHQILLAGEVPRCFTPPVQYAPAGRDPPPHVVLKVLFLVDSLLLIADAARPVQPYGHFVRVIAICPLRRVACVPPLLPSQQQERPLDPVCRHAADPQFAVRLFRQHPFVSAASQAHRFHV